MQRRDFLKLAIASAVLTACGRREKPPRIGLALGGGGAKGLAHIPMLEVLDELGVKPWRIAGSSIGAVMGALYASGKSGADIRKLIDGLTVSHDESWLESLFSEDVARWFDFVELRLGKGGLIDTSAFIEYLNEQIGVSRFGELSIPLQVVATDMWSRQQVSFDTGELMPAIRASIAVPGLFEPVSYQGRVLVDGGLVNPVPYDLLFDDCDLVIAVDVLGQRTPDSGQGPGYLETTFNTFQIMQAAIMREKLQRRPPDIYVKPEIVDIRMLEFYKAEQIYTQVESERKRLFRTLERELPGKAGDKMVIIGQ